MTKTTIIVLSILIQISALAQNEWVLQPWVQVYGDTNNQMLGFNVAYLGKKGDSTVVGVSEANNEINIYHIKSQGDTIPCATYTGLKCTTGDFNGDGMKDLVTSGNPAWFAGLANGDNATKVYLGLSEGVFDTIPFFEKHQEPLGHVFGQNVAVGKINGDIYDDLLITDPGYPIDTAHSPPFGVGINVGRVYLFLGGTQMDTSTYLVLKGMHPYNFFGWNVASGDLNNDGFDDIIVRGYDQSNIGPQGNNRFVYIKIYLGGNIIDTTEWKYFKGNNNSGYGVACFDVNGDNIKDLLWTNYSVKDSLQSVDIHYSNNGNIDSIPSLVLLDGWAENIANAGDMNGDGYKDILISANGSDQSGDTYIFEYSGGPKMDTHYDAGVGLVGDSRIGGYGSMASIGDINGDGYDDIIAGAPGYKWFAERGYWGIFLGNQNITVPVVKETIPAPENFELLQNYPNPFNPSTTIEYTLASSGNVTLKIYNILGEEVKILVEEYQTQGIYKVGFNARNLSSGVYYYTLTLVSEDGKSKEITKQMALVR